MSREKRKTIQMNPFSLSFYKQYKNAKSIIMYKSFTVHAQSFQFSILFWGCTTPVGMKIEHLSSSAEKGLGLHALLSKALL